MKKRTIAVLAVSVAVVFSALVLVLSSSPKSHEEPQARVPITLGGWVPPNLDPKPAGNATWTLQFPTAAADLAGPPVNEPHIVLNVGRPAPIHTIKLSAEPAGTLKVWATVLDDRDKEEVILVGEGTGPEVEMVVPWRFARKRI